MLAILEWVPTPVEILVSPTFAGESFFGSFPVKNKIKGLGLKSQLE
jgi:hypothetical protein